MQRRVLAGLSLLLALVVGVAAPAGAHTESDAVAVPARGAATVTFRPTHGCTGAPTIEVSVRAPVEGATAGPVEGWEEAARPDGEGNTILEWTGGVLPADQAGAFPITFTAPDAPGELLTFPAVQVCEGDGELAWIDGDPEGDYPAPRLLVLPAGQEPAATIDDVPADAPGRDQLREIVDVDGPTEEEPTTTASEPAGPTTADPGEPAPTTAPAEDEQAAPATAPASDEDGGGGGTSAVAIGFVALGALAVAAYMVLRRRSSSS